MRYQRVAVYVADTLWAMHPSKLGELVAVLAFRAAGHEYTDAEIAARIGDAGSRPSAPSSRGAVAVIPIRGVIAHRMSGMEDTSGGTSCEQIGRMIDQVAADPSIGTIVYDFDTPGGTVPGIQELAAKMFALRGVKTQIAQINSMAASAGYWLASQCDERVCIPSGTAGSIGVYSAHQDLSKALEREGIDITLISAGKYKVEGNMFEALTPEALAVKQASVDVAYAQFTTDVARGLGVSPAAVRHGYGEGRALHAKDAKAAGLVDRIGTMDDTIGRLVGRTASGGGLRAEDLRDTSPAGSQRRAYVAELMASARGLLHADGEPADLVPPLPPDAVDPEDMEDLEDLTGSAAMAQARRRRLL